MLEKVVEFALKYLVSEKARQVIVFVVALVMYVYVKRQQEVAKLLTSDHWKNRKKKVEKQEEEEEGKGEEENMKNELVGIGLGNHESQEVEKENEMKKVEKEGDFVRDEYLGLKEMIEFEKTRGSGDRGDFFRTKTGGSLGSRTIKITQSTEIEESDRTKNEERVEKILKEGDENVNGDTGIIHSFEENEEKDSHIDFSGNDLSVGEVRTRTSDHDSKLNHESYEGEKKTDFENTEPEEPRKEINIPPSDEIISHEDLKSDESPTLESKESEIITKEEEEEEEEAKPEKSYDEMTEKEKEDLKRKKRLAIRRKLFQLRKERRQEEKKMKERMSPSRKKTKSTITSTPSEQHQDKVHISTSEESSDGYDEELDEILDNVRNSLKTMEVVEKSQDESFFDDINELN